MRVTAKGEYATRAVLHLATEYPEVVTINEIAERHRIPTKYLEQILLELKRGGLLESRRGVHGGYLLARAPAEISVGEVLQIVDGKFIESSCEQRDAERGYVCPDPELCGLKRVWEEVRVAVERILFETSFADVCAQTRRNGTPDSSGKILASINL
jgi:Rrf2 family protein